MTWQEAVRLIEAARGPADLFGDDAAGRFRRLARLTHPDTSPAAARTQPAYRRLTALWQQYRGQPHRGGGPGRLVAAGDIANLYQAGPGLQKIPRDPADNDLIGREIAALALLHAGGDPRFACYLPRLAGRERQRDPGTGAARRVSVLGRLDGFVSLADVRRAYPAGLDPRDAAWIWRRLLVALGFAHRAGVVHGAVLPAHVMIHPAEHGLALIDWCYSVLAPGDRVPAVVTRYRDWYPPEVAGRRDAGPGTDIYLATRCMTDLMGGADGRGGRAPRRLTAFAGGCMLRQPSRRPQDAWRLLAELDDLLGRLYGPRRFRPFAMPAPG